MGNLLAIFIVCNIINVILQTIKSLVTHKGGPLAAALINALAFSFYTYIIIITNCDLPDLIKCIIVGLCNLIGVYIVKLAELKLEKEKMWKIEVTASPYVSENLIQESKDLGLSFHYVDIQKYMLFDFFCETKEESKQLKKILKKYDCKYFVIESRGLLD